MVVQAAVFAARARRAAAAATKLARIEWFKSQVARQVSLTMHQRVQLATEHVKSKVVRNISRPVGKSVTGGGRDSRGKFLKRRTRVTSRSLPGEFPRADTTQLMKTIFGEVRRVSEHVSEGYVGTPLQYGLILEVSAKLNRSFLVRTLNEERATVRSILTRPMA